jgi:hypothetical protein
VEKKKNEKLTRTKELAERTRISRVGLGAVRGLGPVAGVDLHLVGISRGEFRCLQQIREIPKTAGSFQHLHPKNVADHGRSVAIDPRVVLWHIEEVLHCDVECITFVINLIDIQSARTQSVMNTKNK